MAHLAIHQVRVALIAFVLIKLAHRAQSAVESLTRFARLVRANVVLRKPLNRLRANRGMPGHAFADHAAGARPVQVEPAALCNLLI